MNAHLDTAGMFVKDAAELVVVSLITFLISHMFMNGHSARYFAPNTGQFWRRVSRSRYAAPVSFTALALLIWWNINGDYGTTWDETPHVNYGKAVLTYFTTSLSFQEFDALLAPPNCKLYSPALDFIIAVAGRVLQTDDYAIRHAIQGLLWVASFWPTCRLAAHLRGIPASWLSGVALLGMPSLLGHAFNNPNDMPLACAALWHLLAVVWATRSNALGPRQCIGLGMGMAGVLMIRPGAWFLVALWGLVPLAHLWHAWRMDSYRLRPCLFRIVWALGGALVIAWACMLILWPHAHRQPFSFPIHAALFALKFNEVYPVLYRGITFPSNQLPVDYLAGYVFFTLPIPIFCLFLVGQVAVLQRLRYRVAAWAPVVGAAFLIWFPMAFFVVARPNIYDGMRHFLFMLPAIAILAGAGASTLYQLLRRQIPGVVTGAIVAGLLISALPSAVRLHPYQVAYYNSLAGPPETLHARFETDYWVSSFREAAQWINQQPAPADRPLTVIVSATGLSYNAFAHFLDPKVRSGAALGDFRNNGLDPAIDYYVGMVRYGQYQNFSRLPIAHTIERDGVLLCVIRRNQ